VDELHPGKMPLQGLCQRPREHGDPVLGPLPIAHGDLVVGKIDIFHTQAHAFHKAQASPIEQAGHQVRHTGEPGEHAVYFIAGKDRGEATRAFCPLNMLKRWKEPEQRSVQKLISHYLPRANNRPQALEIIQLCLSPC